MNTDLDKLKDTILKMNIANDDNDIFDLHYQLCGY